MTTKTQGIKISQNSNPVDAAGKFVYRFLKAIPTWALWMLVIIWSIPTGSLFINSFRTRDAQRSTGWWTSFTEGGWTFDNYTTVLSSQQSGGM